MWQLVTGIDVRTRIPALPNRCFPYQVRARFFRASVSAFQVLMIRTVYNNSSQYAGGDIQRLYTPCIWLCESSSPRFCIVTYEGGIFYIANFGSTIDFVVTICPSIQSSHRHISSRCPSEVVCISLSLQTWNFRVSRLPRGKKKIGEWTLRRKKLNSLKKLRVVHLRTFVFRENGEP